MKILEEDDGVYEKGDKFKSFHHQAKYPMSSSPASYRFG